MSILILEIIEKMNNTIKFYYSFLEINYDINMIYK